MKHLLSTGSLALMLLLAGCGSDEPEEPEVQIPPGSDTTVTDEDQEEAEQAEETDETEEATDETEESTDETNEETEESAEESNTDEIDPFSFFMADGTTAHFEGVGIEFAALTIRTEYLEEDYVALYEDNGGTTLLKVYRLSDDRVDLVKDEAEFHDDYTPTSEELDELEVISTYLEFPLEVGDTFGERTVIETGATVETPYETFDNAIVLESKESENTTNTWYFVEGYGEVKREFVSQEEGEDEFKVTSSLESME